MTRVFIRLLLLTGIAVVVLLAAGAIMLVAIDNRIPPASPLPNPNGYDDLAKAWQLVILTREEATNHDTLQALVSTNAEALRLVRLGLSRPCAVPTDAFIANMGNNSGDLIGLRSLARLLHAEGRLAELNNRPVDAAGSYLDTVRLGTATSHGALLINRLVGIACEGMGSMALIKLLPKLTYDQMRPLVRELEQMDRDTAAWPEVIGNENRFVRTHLGSYRNPIRLAVDLWLGRDVHRAGAERHGLAAARLRLLATELALRSYRCDHGIPPGNLQQLVPKYLQQVPSDPFGDGSLAYRRNGTNWVLYSLGPDRIDDGGKPARRISSDKNPSALGIGSPDSRQYLGDVLYDSAW